MRWIAVVTAVVAIAALVVPAGGRTAVRGLPASWIAVAHGEDGGTVWSGRIPDRFVPSDRRSSAVYLPPGFDAAKRYPVVYLLHGMRGAPSSFYAGLHFADVADRLIAAGTVPPFIGVMPVAGPTVNPDSGEWAGVWEDFVVRDVVPWIDDHLPTIASPAGRALAGLCAGGFGAVDIGLLHPGLFGTLESWEGYFAPVYRDGPFVHASSVPKRPGWRRPMSTAPKPPAQRPASARPVGDVIVGRWSSIHGTTSWTTKSSQTPAHSPLSGLTSGPATGITPMNGGTVPAAINRSATSAKWRPA